MADPWREEVSPGEIREEDTPSSFAVFPLIGVVEEGGGGGGADMISLFLSVII